MGIFYHGTPNGDTPGAGTATNDTLDGLGGNDRLEGNAGNDSVIGGVGDDTLTGGAGLDSLDGGVGADQMYGGNDNDLFIVDDLGDQVFELDYGGGGTDLVKSSVDFTLPDYVENLTITGSIGRLGVGNSFIVYQMLTGGSGDDTLMGLDNYDSLDGGAGADSLVGGAGTDYYKVDNVGDKVVETSASGADVVASTVSFTLSDYVETLLLSGANLNGTGSAQANTINGTSGANTLKGLAGNDSLAGLGATDKLYGAAGNDVLNGGTGADTMEGGAGSDSYTVDDAGDKIVEIGGPADSVASYLTTYTLGAGLERLTLAGDGNSSGTGNSGANVLTGNGGANGLKGLGGADSLDGYTGVDTLTGGAGDDTLHGGVGADKLNGGDGNDVLDWDADDTRRTGGAGEDTLRVTGAGEEVSLATGASGIEVVDLTGTGANELLLAMADLAAGALQVEGDGDDTVTLQDDGWTMTDDGSGSGYEIWSNGDTTLEVALAVEVALAI